MPSFILIYPTVLRHNTPTSQTRQTGQDRQRSDGVGRTAFGRPLVKRFALCYRTVVCPVCLSVCLSVTLVYCGQRVGWTNMKLDMKVGLGHGHIVLDGDPPPSQKGHGLQFSADVCCGQAGWLEMPLGREVCLGPDHIVLNGGPSCPPQKRGHSPQFSAHVCCGQTAGWIKMPLGTELDLGPGDIVLDGGPALP